MPDSILYPGTLAAARFDLILLTILLPTLITVLVIYFRGRKREE